MNDCQCKRTRNLILLRFSNPKCCEIKLTKQQCCQSINPTFAYICITNINLVLL